MYANSESCLSNLADYSWAIIKFTFCDDIHSWIYYTVWLSVIVLCLSGYCWI